MELKVAATAQTIIWMKMHITRYLAVAFSTLLYLA
jgi:hypothetical protein